MTKRRLDDSSFANVLRQKIKEDPIQKQQAAQNTFALLMKAQQPRTQRVIAEPSYEYFNTVPLPTTKTSKCCKCQNGSVYDACAQCEGAFCSQCLASCAACQSVFCSTCSVIDYSMSMDQVFCLSCLQR